MENMQEDGGIEQAIGDDRSQLAALVADSGIAFECFDLGLMCTRIEPFDEGRAQSKTSSDLYLERRWGLHSYRMLQLWWILHLQS